MWKLSKNEQTLLEYDQNSELTSYTRGTLSLEFNNWVASRGGAYSPSGVLKPIILPTSNPVDLYVLARHFLLSRNLLRGTKFEGTADLRDNARNLRRDVIY